MIIGIDGNEANVRQRVGIGEYAYELLLQLVNIRYQISNIKYSIYLKNNPRDDLPPAQGHWQYSVFGPRKLWTQFALPLRLYTGRPKPDVFFSPSHYAPRFSPVPTVISVMDLSFLHFPQLFNRSDLYQLKNWTAYSVKNARKILTISSSSKSDIIKTYGVAEARVVVTYPGLKQIQSLSPQVYTMSQLRSQNGIKDSYILFVGTLQPRKNISRLIEAFAKISSENPETQLVIVGKKGWLYEDILNAPKRFNVEGKVLFLDFVSDKELPELYRHAKFFVLPSLYEGFGLPVLEAMQYGCPVITSKVSSLPEAAGDAALYVDPESVDDIAEKMQRLLHSEALRNELVGKGKKQAARFSWEKAAHETLGVLKGVMEEQK